MDKELRRKRLYYQSCHRGSKEMDIVFIRFADGVLPSLNEAEMDMYEALLQEQDVDLWRWFTNEAPLPPELNNAVWHKLVEINAKAFR